MKIVLVQPPIGRRNLVGVTPSLGIPYLAAILGASGVDVTCIVSDAQGFNAPQTAEKVIALNPDVLGISVTTLSVNSSIAIARAVRERTSAVMLAGGAHATVLPEELLHGGFDFVIRGEAEKTILELAGALAEALKSGSISRRPFTGGGIPGVRTIKGLSYLLSGEVAHNEPREPIQNLDEIPFPAWHLMPLGLYKSDFKQSSRSLPVLTSRGCPGQCIFCYKGLFGSRYRVRSPENIVAEIEYLKEKFNIDEFDILDDSFTSIPKRAIAVCELLVGRGLKLKWGLPSGIRVDTVSEELMAALKKAGCYRIGFGVESGNNTILRAIKKHVTKEQVVKAVQMAKRYGFITSCYFMIGNLGETTETVNDTINFAIELDPDIAQFSIAIPYPGSEMYELLKAGNKLTAVSWDDYDYFKADSAVFLHDNLRPGEVYAKWREAYRKFYYRPAYILKNLKLLFRRGGIRNVLKLLKITG